jgi:hypothetical protein
VTVENGYLIFREQNAAAPGVVSAVGYGGFDGRTWSLQVQTIVGTAGTASLELQGDDTLRGEADVAGARFVRSATRSSSTARTRSRTSESTAAAGPNSGTRAIRAVALTAARRSYRHVPERDTSSRGR